MIKKETLLARYEALSETDQKILQIKALLYQLPGKGKFIDVVRQLELKTHDGKPFRASTLNTVLDRLLGKQLLTKNDLHCEPSIVHTIAEYAVIGDRKNPFISALKATPYFKNFPDFTLNRDLSDLRTVHLAVHQKKTALFDHIPQNGSHAQYIDGLMEALTRLFKHSSPEWVATLPSTLTLYACLAKLCPHYLSDTLPKAPLNRWKVLFESIEIGKRPSYVNYLYAITQIFLGNVAIGKQMATQSILEAEHLHLLQGLLAFLDQRPQEALLSYQYALKLTAKAAKRRDWFFIDFQAPFFLLATLQNKETLSKTAKGLANVQKYFGGGFHPYFSCLERIVLKVRGQDEENADYLFAFIASKSSSGALVDPLTYHHTLFTLVLIGWLISFLDNSERAKPQIESLLDFVKQAQTLYASTHPLLSHLFLEVLAHCYPKQYTKALALSKFSPLNCRSQLPIQEKWQHALEQLSRVIAPSESTTPSAQASKRLAWLFQPNTQELEVVEQKMQKERWSRGRAIAKSRLHNEVESFEYLDAQDKAALTGLEYHYVGGWGYYNRQETYFFNPRNQDEKQGFLSWC